MYGARIIRAMSTYAEAVTGQKISGRVDVFAGDASIVINSGIEQNEEQPNRYGARIDIEKFFGNAADHNPGVLSTFAASLFSCFEPECHALARSECVRLSCPKGEFDLALHRDVSECAKCGHRNCDRDHGPHRGHDRNEHEKQRMKKISVAPSIERKRLFALPIPMRRFVPISDNKKVKAGSIIT